MVDVTLLELNLEGAEFSANAPFSGSEGDSGSGSTVSKLLKRSSKSSSSSSTTSSSDISDDDDESSGGVDLDVGTDAGDEDNSTSIAPLVVLGALVVFFAVFRKFRRRKSGEEQRELVEYEA